MEIHTDNLAISNADCDIPSIPHIPTEDVDKRKHAEQRFWSKIKKADCWDWQASANGNGYGQIKWGNAIRASHRVSWELHNGSIPTGLFVLHRCDNRRCVSPDHLFLGTHADNMQDMVAKGRQSRGEGIGISKLTDDNVKKIRLRYAAKNVSMAALAKEYGVRKRTIKRVIRRITWKHVD